jgi:hypothetical protein
MYQLQLPPLVDVKMSMLACVAAAAAAFVLL